MANPSIRNEAEKYFFQPSSWLDRFDWGKVFATQHPALSTSSPPIHVDLGAGDGGFVCERARRHPETCFLAVERLLGRARKIARRACREGLTHVRVVRIEASYAVERLFPPGSVASMTILFPDPWPKRRHHKNRLVQGPFLEKCATCLRPDGWLAIKTDDAAYFEQIKQLVQETPRLKSWAATRPESLLPEATDFEVDFKRDGCPVYFLAARRRAEQEVVS